MRLTVALGARMAIFSTSSFVRFRLLILITPFFPSFLLSRLRATAMGCSNSWGLRSFITFRVSRLGRWSMTVPSLMAGTGIICSGTFMLPSRHERDVGLPYWNPIGRLPEVRGVRRVVKISGDLVHSRQGMQDAHVLFRDLQELAVDVEAVLEPIVFYRIGEALLLDARHVEDVQLGRDFVQVCRDNIGDLLFLKIGEIILGHLQGFRSDEEELCPEMAHGHAERVHGAAILQIPDKADVEAVELPLFLLDGE